MYMDVALDTEVHPTMPKIITGEILELATIDTRSNQARYFKQFSDAEGNMDDAAFKKAINSVKGKYNKPVLVIEALSSHYGYVNGNHAYYRPEYGPKAAKTFTSPFQKPVLRSHNLFQDSDPIGRVSDAKYVAYDVPQNKKNDLHTRKGVIRTFSTITDADAIEKIMDNRYLTQSVSGVTPMSTARSAAPTGKTSPANTSSARCTTTSFATRTSAPSPMMRSPLCGSRPTRKPRPFASKP